MSPNSPVSPINNTVTPTEQAASLLTIPGELRNQVYEYHFDEQSDEHVTLEPVRPSTAAHWETDTRNVTQICRRIRGETLKFLFGYREGTVVHVPFRYAGGIFEEEEGSENSGDDGSEEDGSKEGSGDEDGSEEDSGGDDSEEDSEEDNDDSDSEPGSEDDDNSHQLSNAELPSLYRILVIDLFYMSRRPVRSLARPTSDHLRDLNLTPFVRYRRENPTFQFFILSDPDEPNRSIIGATTLTDPALRRFEDEVDQVILCSAFEGSCEATFRPKASFRSTWIGPPKSQKRGRGRLPVFKREKGAEMHKWFKEIWCNEDYDNFSLYMEWEGRKIEVWDE